MTFAIRTCVLASGLLACSGQTIFAGSDVPVKAQPEDAAMADAAPIDGSSADAAPRDGASEDALVDAAPDAVADVGPPPIRCRVLEADCDGDPMNGCEVDLRHDPDNCGQCGRACADDGVVTRCDMGQCTAVCEAPGLYGDCDGDPSNGCETFVWADDDNCGQCGVQCNCRDGRCTNPSSP